MKERTNRWMNMKQGISQLIVTLSKRLKVKQKTNRMTPTLTKKSKSKQTTNHLILTKRSNVKWTLSQLMFLCGGNTTVSVLESSPPEEDRGETGEEFKSRL